MSTLEKIQAIEKELAELPAQEFEYPLFKRSKETGFVVKFYGLTTGVVVVTDGTAPVGETASNWFEHTRQDLWEDVAYDRERDLFDGQLVIAHDELEPFAREIVFYDAINRCAFFKCDGDRDGYRFSDYEPFEGALPNWAIQAYKKLNFETVEYSH